MTTFTPADLEQLKAKGISTETVEAQQDELPMIETDEDLDIDEIDIEIEDDENNQDEAEESNEE